MQALRSLLSFPSPSAADVPPPSTSPPAVPHTRQGAEWDCGLACVLSLLAARRIPTTLPHLRALLTSNSIWSIDLLALLSRYHFRAVLYTVYAGANPSHSDKSFYSAEWGDDSERITRLFQTYETAVGSGGVRVERRSLTADAVYDSVVSGHIVLLLVDARYLQCPHCRTHQSSTLASHFLGHFVLLTRIERRSGAAMRNGNRFISSGVEAGDAVRLVWYMDPASDGCAECVCSESWMERARKSDGTDEDCIVILGAEHSNGSASADQLHDGRSAAQSIEAVDIHRPG